MKERGAFTSRQATSRNRHQAAPLDYFGTTVVQIYSTFQVRLRVHREVAFGVWGSRLSRLESSPEPTGLHTVWSACLIPRQDMGVLS